MNTIQLKKGFSIPIAGTPTRQLHMLDPPRHVGMVPEKIPFVKPRLLVEEGDPVSIGTPLFEDKRNTRIRFLSPGGGQVARIVFGARRIIRQIIIARDKDEPCLAFDVPTVGQLEAIPRQALVDILLTGGMWPFLKALPFMDIAAPDTVPPSIIVRLGDDEPFGPDPEVYLEGREAQFGLGIALLDKLCDRVAVNLTGDEAILSALPDQAVIQRFTGCYPSGNPSVQLYQTRTGSQQNRSWFIDGQDVILLGEFFRTGRYPVQRIMTVGGSLAPTAEHVSTRAGVPLRLLCGVVDKSAARCVVGGVFTGFSSSVEGFMGFYQNALNLIDEGDREEPFGFIRPGYSKPSYSSTFLSAFRRHLFPMDCGQHGEVRACVNCGTCAKICPVDILPQFTMKCLVADEVEEALAHGLLDCAECGLCTYACPSKIQLREVFQVAKAQYYKEIS
jgi:Na+-transporting NADH:ubiquinone oxidoreductase subunit A